MSDLIPTNITVPAHIANRMGKGSALAASITGGIGGGEFGPRISIKGARFRIVKDGAETVLPQTELEVVVVGANPKLSKQWFAAKYDPNAEPAAPDCYSLDGVAPVPDCSDPQNDLCATCPHNAWGSKIGDAGQKLKSCTDQKRLAVVAADDIAGDIYLLAVTPAALKGLNDFQKQLAVRGIAPEIVRTKVSFDTDAPFPRLKFGFGGFLDEASIDAVDKLINTDKVLTVTGEKAPTVQAVAAPAAKPKPQLVKPAPAPAPVEEPAPEPDAPAADAGLAKGFGAGATATPTAPAAKAAAPKVAAKPKPEPKVVETDSGDALAAEIEALLSGMADDAGTGDGAGD